MMPMYQGMLTNQLSGAATLESLLLWDADLFANMLIPPELDKLLAVAEIRRRHGNAPLYHPDPRWMKGQIYVWSRVNYEIWQKLAATTKFEYNPIWNTDATERTKDVTTLARDTTGNASSLTHKDGQADSHAWDTGNTWQTADGQTHSEYTGDTSGNVTGTDDFTENGSSQGQTTGEEKTKTGSTSLVISNSTASGTSKTDTTGETKNFVSPENTADYQPDERTETTSTSNTETSDKSDTTSNTTNAGTSDTDTKGTSSETWEHASNRGTGENSTGHENGSQDGTSKDVQHRTDDRSQDSQTRSRETGRAESLETGKENAETVYTHEWTRGGNIGVTTTQRMIWEERNVVQYNVYEQIAKSFHEYFCLDVY